MYKAYEKDATKLYVGTVEKIESFERNGRKSIAVTLKDFKDEKVVVYFNNGDPGQESAEMRADQFEKMKCKSGSFLSVLAFTDDETKGTATGVRAKYSGRWVFKNEAGEESSNVLVGWATRPRSPKEKMFVVTMPVETFQDGVKSTQWFDITFFDGESGDRKWSNAEHAQKVLAGADKAFVAVSCGKKQDREYQGKIYSSFIGYRMTKRP